MIKYNVKHVRISLTVISLLFILAGIMRGEYSEVLMKATKICLQCIGIG